MTLTLARNFYKQSGILGELHLPTGQVLYTLEHSYANGIDWEPKVPVGTYKCVQGWHALHNLVKFKTYEVTGVTGHSGILFHRGNINGDSDGCILLGLALDIDAGLVLNSGKAFDAFLLAIGDVPEFELVIVKS